MEQSGSEPLSSLRQSRMVGGRQCRGDRLRPHAVGFLPELSAGPARMAEKGDTPGTRYGA